MHLESDRSSSFSPEREKVFAFGIVRYAMKYYYRGIFWPHIFDEYGVKLSPNKQTEINDCFRLIMLKTGKTYDDKSIIKKRFCHKWQNRFSFQMVKLKSYGVDDVTCREYCFVGEKLLVEFVVMVLAKIHHFA